MGKASLHPMDVPENVRVLEELVLAANRKHVQAGKVSVVKEEVKIGSGGPGIAGILPGNRDGWGSDENTNPSLGSYQTTNDGSLGEAVPTEQQGLEQRKRKRSESPEKAELCASAVQSLLGIGSCSTTTSTISVDSTGAPKRDEYFSMFVSDVGTDVQIGPWPAGATRQSLQDSNERMAPQHAEIENNHPHAPPLLLASSSGLELAPSTTKPVSAQFDNAPLWPAGSDEVDDDADAAPLPPIQLRYELGPSADGWDDLLVADGIENDNVGTIKEDDTGTIGAQDLGEIFLNSSSTVATRMGSGWDGDLSKVSLSGGGEAGGGTENVFDDVQSVDLCASDDEAVWPVLSSDLDFDSRPRCAGEEEFVADCDESFEMPVSVNLVEDASATTDEMDLSSELIFSTTRHPAFTIVDDDDYVLTDSSFVDIVPPSPPLSAPSPTLATLDRILHDDTLFPVDKAMCNVFVPKCSQFHSPLRRMLRRRGMRLVHGIHALVEGAGWKGGYVGTGWRFGMVIVPHEAGGEVNLMVAKTLEEELKERSAFFSSHSCHILDEF